MSRIKLSLLSILVSLFACASAYAQTGLSEEMHKARTQAEAGDVQAQFRLAQAYDSGRGAPRDGKEALKWYQAAAKGGDATAQTKIGTLYHAGKQYDDARAWYEKAAAQNHAMAIHYLATLYDMGSGVDQDRKKAFDLYAKAAELGTVDAMWRAAYMYGTGDGVERDALLNCVWIYRANQRVTLDNHILMAMLGKQIATIERTLSADELAKCKEQAEAWTPTGNSDKPS